MWHLRLHLLLGLAFNSGACAVYRPAPLPTPDALLAPPRATFIAQDAAVLRRPFLEPVQIDLAAPLEEPAIATLAILSNPDLKALRARAGVADAQAFAAGLLPDPTFSVGIDHRLSGPDPVDNLAAALGLDLITLRTRRVLLAKAQADARQVWLNLAWAEWQTAGQARLQAARIAGLERQLALARTSREVARSNLERTFRAAGRGDLAGDQVQAARLAALDAADRLHTAERDLTAARLELTRLLGLPPGYPLRIASTSPPALVPDADKLFALACASRYDLRALEAGYAAAEASVRKAVLDQFPGLALTINGARDTSRNVLLGPSVAFTLPLWNRNRGGIAIEQATRTALKAEYEARLLQTRAEIAAAARTLAITHRQRLVLLRDLPALRGFAAASRRAADRGDLSQTLAETAEQTLRDREMQLAQAGQDAAEQLISLELLTGLPRESWGQ